MKRTIETIRRGVFGGLVLLAAGFGGAVAQTFPLNIELRDDNAKYIYFTMQTGLVYNIEQSTNLMDWSILDTVVADDTNYGFYAFGGGTKFYRLAQQDSRIQFPNWSDFIEQFACFDVTTSITGTYHLELYGDGALLYETTATVPPSGEIGVYDSSYDPNQWPYAGEYAVNNWELRVTVTPGGGGGAAQATVQKKQRRRNQWRNGVTIQMYNAYTISWLVQDEIDEWMQNYFLANYQASYQVDLNGNRLDEFTERTGLAKLTDAGSWAQLKGLLYDTNYGTQVSDLHYFGHGARTGLGADLKDHSMSISLAELQNPYLREYPMVYAGLDGCNTAGGFWWWQKPDLLKALVGYGKKISRDDFTYNGWLPRFGWGWTSAKTVAYVQQGSLNDAHFEFVADFYYKLTERDAWGFLKNTYEDAIAFGKYPTGLFHFFPGTHNYEGDSIDYVGCYDCFFDEGR